jgi:hypothetical protein
MSIKKQLLSNLLPWLLESVMKQGMSFILIGLMAYFFYTWGIGLQLRNDKKIELLEAKIEKLQTDITEYNRQDRLEMVRVIQMNTAALSNLKCK